MGVMECDYCDSSMCKVFCNDCDGHYICSDCFSVYKINLKKYLDDNNLTLLLKEKIDKILDSYYRSEADFTCKECILNLKERQDNLCFEKN